MAVLAGINGVLYRSTNGRTTWPGGPTSSTTPYFFGTAPNTLVACNQVHNLKSPRSLSESDISVRASEFDLALATSKKVEVQFDMPYDPSNSDVAFFQTAFDYGTGNSVACAVFDSAITTGVQGIWADWTVIDFSITQDRDKHQVAEVKIKPTNATGIMPQKVMSS